METRFSDFVMVLRKAINAARPAIGIVSDARAQIREVLIKGRVEWYKGVQNAKWQHIQDRVEARRLVDTLNAFASEAQEIAKRIESDIAIGEAWLVENGYVLPEDKDSALRDLLEEKALRAQAAKSAIADLIQDPSSPESVDLQKFLAKQLCESFGYTLGEDENDN